MKFCELSEFLMKFSSISKFLHACEVMGAFDNSRAPFRKTISCSYLSSVGNSDEFEGWYSLTGGRCSIQVYSSNFVRQLVRATI